MLEHAYLAAHPLFEGLPGSLLAEVIPQTSTRTFLRGDLLFSAGTKAEGLFVIQHGHVAVELEGASIVFRGPSELLGEQALLSLEGLRSASVKALDLVSAIWIPRLAFATLCQAPAFAMSLARELSRKLADATGERAHRYSKEDLVFGEFRAHVAPEVLDRLLQQGKDEYGRPRKVVATILFSDIRNFTKRSASMTPEEIAADLSAYLSHTVQLIHEHGGLVDKFVGDAVMAVWGAFDSAGDDNADQAFACARRMIETSEQFAFGGHPIQIGVGINSGEVFIGNVGGDGKRQFTVLGTPVNLAARFEAETKELGVGIAMGVEVANRLPRGQRALLHEHQGVHVKGADAQTLFVYSSPRADRKELE